MILFRGIQTGPVLELSNTGGVSHLGIEVDDALEISEAKAVTRNACPNRWKSEAPSDFRNV